jgi:hypothetical protein
MAGMVIGWGPEKEEGQRFFFEKKNQKTFIRLRGCRPSTGQRVESLFASFSSEKEDLP